MVPFKATISDMEHALRKYRAENGIPIGDLAETAGVGKGLLSRIERGVIQQPRLKTVRKLIEATGGTLSMKDFLPQEESAA